MYPRRLFTSNYNSSKFPTKFTIDFKKSKKFRNELIRNNKSDFEISYYKGTWYSIRFTKPLPHAYQDLKCYRLSISDGGIYLNILKVKSSQSSSFCLKFIEKNTKGHLIYKISPANNYLFPTGKIEIQLGRSENGRFLQLLSRNKLNKYSFAVKTKEHFSMANFEKKMFKVDDLNPVIFGYNDNIDPNSYNTRDKDRVYQKELYSTMDRLYEAGWTLIGETNIKVSS